MSYFNMLELIVRFKNLFINDIGNLEKDLQNKGLRG